ncbi:permease [Anaeromyxobacter diazotrophicus]|uniref:Permease n=1 Tax=Anaeromyxobacter diazotrophicus TaxID=2590199 RepID=A0A7I9VLY2_9BACT|nr:permease [Anaeromyxobacter diazotrophicus]GEJ57140.1 hypothetical protein AMYX_18810 [Anaeromyxobacter diazotrophicus]
MSAHARELAASARAVAPPPRGRARLYGALGGALVLWYALYRLIEPGAELVTRRLLRLDPTTHLGSAVAFFLFEVPKVLLLLVLVVFAVGVVRSYFTPERTRAILSGRRESAGNVLAALLGVVTPFCSCSAVPLFLGFVEVGIPLGVTLSFLVSAPMVNEVALVLLFGLFGWKVAALYLATGLLVAVVSGFILGRLGLERWVEPWVYESMAAAAPAEDAPPLPFAERLDQGLTAVREVVGKVWPYVVAGIAVGAGVHGYVPTGLMAGVLGKGAWWSVPLAVVLGVPMYSNAAGIIPVVQALLEKGAALGTVLAFMMAVIGLSAPEAIILRKVLRPPLIATFFGVVAGGILLVGWLFNAVL